MLKRKGEKGAVGMMAESLIRTVPRLGRRAADPPWTRNIPEHGWEERAPPAAGKLRVRPKVGQTERRWE